MIDELIPLFECGCPVCLEQARKNFVEIADELAAVLADPDAETIRPHSGPLDRPAPIRELSAAGFRRVAAVVRHLADEVDPEDIR